MSSEILVVTENDASLAAMLHLLADAGYRTRGASTFEEGKRLLDTTSPDLLIADQRLGEFNGLHLVLRGRAGNPDMGAIVTTPATVPGLDADARLLDTEYVVTPTEATDWLQPVSSLLEKAGRRRALKIAS
jgi:DNA-binding NtrC family response regulator